MTRIFKIAYYDDWAGLYEDEGSGNFKNIYEDHEVEWYLLEIAQGISIRLLERKEVDYDWFDEYYNEHGSMPDNWNDIKFN